MVRGQSTESLALEVAAKSGLPGNIVDRMQALRIKQQDDVSTW